MKKSIGALLLLALLSGCSQAPAPPSGPSAADLLAEGAKVYTKTCASCHMADGGGVPNLQPDLNDNPVVTGDPTTLIRVLIQGPAKVLPPDRPHFSNTMPSFAPTLSDEQIAAVLTYIRQQYNNNPSAIDVQKVAVIRNQYGG